MGNKILSHGQANNIKSKFLNKSVTQDTKELLKTTQTNKSYLFEKTGYRMMDLYPDTYKSMTEIPYDIDYSKLTCADELFKGCSALKNIDNLDLSNAISANHCFDGCTELLSINGLKTPLLGSAEAMFYDCQKLQNLSEFDTSKCQNFYLMFSGCRSLPQIFPWTLNMLSVKDWATKYGGKMMFEASSVKNLNAYGTVPIVIKPTWYDIELECNEYYYKKIKITFNDLLLIKKIMNNQISAAPANQQETIDVNMELYTYDGDYAPATRTIVCTCNIDEWNSYDFYKKFKINMIAELEHSLSGKCLYENGYDYDEMAATYDADTGKIIFKKDKKYVPIKSEFKINFIGG